MKKIIILLLLAIIARDLSAQSTTASTNAGGGASVNTRYLGWDNNIIPLWLKTNGVVRARLNNSAVVNINGVNQDVTGYFGIGKNGFFTNNAPIAMLHLEGTDNTNTPGIGSFGWRSWMQTGLYMRENSDAMYVGMQNQPGTTNRSDAVINWNDDGGDRLKIVMTTSAGGNGANTNIADASSRFGYEYMQFITSNYQTNNFNSPAGFVGIGPVFTNTRPQSRLHINSEGNLETWFQISSQTGTGQTQTDGFRLGIATDGTVNIRQQENRPMIFATDWDNTTGGIAGGERMRIMAVGMAGVPNPGNIFAANTTRVAINYDGNNPITAPRSLLHLGRNTGAFSQQGADGWRPWMDIGMFVSDGTDNVYLGLKKQGTTDRSDAVLSWGDNQATQAPDGADNLLFVFTATTSSLIPSTGQAPTANGVEGMRMTPTPTSVNTGIGGNPGTNNYFNNSMNPTQTLEVNSIATTASAINSGLRFTDLNSTVTPLATNPGAGVLAVDANGDVVYVKNSGVANAENGCSVNGNNKIVLGNDLGTNSAMLTSNREIPMRDLNLLFTQKGRIGLGSNFTGGTILPVSKFEVYTDDFTPIALKATSNLNLTPILYQMNQIENNTIGSIENTTLYIKTTGNSMKRTTGIELVVISPADANVGISSDVFAGNSSNTGGKFYAGVQGSIAHTNTGVSGFGGYSTTTNIGGSFRACNPLTNNGSYVGTNNYGVMAESFGGQN